MSEFPLKLTCSTKFGRYAKISRETVYNLYQSDGWMVSFAGHNLVPSSPIQNSNTEARGMFYSSRADLLFIVLGNTVYSVDYNLTFKVVNPDNPLITTSGYVYIDENIKSQIMFCDGTNLYLYDYYINEFIKLEIDFEASFVTYQDNRFIVARKNTPQWLISDENFLTISQDPIGVGILNQGTLYSVGDILTLDNGGPESSKATIKVEEVAAGGIITKYSVSSPGYGYILGRKYFAAKPPEAIQASFLVTSVYDPEIGFPRTISVVDGGNYYTIGADNIYLINPNIALSKLAKVNITNVNANGKVLSVQISPISDNYVIGQTYSAQPPSPPDPIAASIKVNQVNIYNMPYDISIDNPGNYYIVGQTFPLGLGGNLSIKIDEVGIHGEILKASMVIPPGPKYVRGTIYLLNGGRRAPAQFRVNSLVPGTDGVALNANLIHGGDGYVLGTYTLMAPNPIDQLTIQVTVIGGNDDVAGYGKEITPSLIDKYKYTNTTYSINPSPTPPTLIIAQFKVESLYSPDLGIVKTVSIVNGGNYYTKGQIIKLFNINTNPDNYTLIQVLEVNEIGTILSAEVIPVSSNYYEGKVYKATIPAVPENVLASFIVTNVTNGFTGLQNTGTIQSKPDNVVACVRMPGKSGQLLVIGETVTEVYTDIGSQLFPYQRNIGYNLDYGCLSPATIAIDNDSVCWLAANEKSGPVIMYCSGGKVEKLSNDGINYRLSTLVNPENSFGFIFRQDGQTFYQLTFADPKDDITFVYHFDAGKFYNRSNTNRSCHIAKKVAYFNNNYYFISYNDPNLYISSANYYTYNGKEIPRIIVTSPSRLSNTKPFIINSLTFPISQGTDAYTPETSAGTIVINHQGNIMINNSGLIVIDGGEDITYIPSARVDISISSDGAETFSPPYGVNLNDLGNRKNIFKVYNLGQYNDITFQFRFYGMGRFLVTDGVCDVIQ